MSRLCTLSESLFDFEGQLISIGAKNLGGFPAGLRYGEIMSKRELLCKTFVQTFLTNFFTQQQCHLEFLFKSLGKSVKRRDFLKIINLVLWH